MPARLSKIILNLAYGRESNIHSLTPLLLLQNQDVLPGNPPEARGWGATKPPGDPVRGRVRGPSFSTRPLLTTPEDGDRPAEPGGRPAAGRPEPWRGAGSTPTGRTLEPRAHPAPQRPLGRSAPRTPGSPGPSSSPHPSPRGDSSRAGPPTPQPPAPASPHGRAAGSASTSASNWIRECGRARPRRRRPARSGAGRARRRKSRSAPRPTHLGRGCPRRGLRARALPPLGPEKRVGGATRRRGYGAGRVGPPGCVSPEAPALGMCLLRGDLAPLPLEAQAETTG
ncbi:proline-rich protein 2-like [Bos taurus]|uniref:proline-rich protein 2-like n=1 Tax=Bos taurus TaxID=9913 RepID=UPI000D53AB85|nr:proline-rich protein 2-like [Bos taurus]